MRVYWIERIALTVMAAAAIAISGAESASAQYAPYGQTQQPNYGYSSQPQAGYGYTNPAPAQAAPGYATPQSYQAQQPAAGYSAQPQAQPRYAGYSAQPQTAQQPQYTPTSYSAMEHHAESVAPTLESAPAPVPAPAASVSGGTGNYDMGAPMYQGGYAGCDGGCYNSYNTFDCGCGGMGYGAAGCCNKGCCNKGCGHGCLDGCCGCGCRPKWFGGVYGLLMERDRSDYLPLAFSTDTANTPPYYAGPGEVNMSTISLENDYQGGLEFRLGMYCGGDCCCPPTYGWEVVYWGLFEDDNTFSVSDVTGDTSRLYGMLDMTGYEYDPGDGYRPMNVFWDYGSPTSDYSTPYDVEVRRITGKTSFSMQNLEANLIRLPILCGGRCGSCCGGCGMGGCGMGNCGMGGCGCDSACGGCDGGCGSCRGCGCMPRYSVSTIIGARFIRVDDDFCLRTDYERMDTNAQSWLAFNSETDNTLYGAQIGCRGTYCLGCTGRLALHCASTVGVFNNHIETSKWVDAPSGTARYISTGDSTYVENDKDDVSMLGELRLGASYCVSCNCSVYAGWRVVGITGVALATGQIPQAHVSPAQDRWIDSEGSLFVHGLQAGMQYNY